MSTRRRPVPRAVLVCAGLLVLCPSTLALAAQHGRPTPRTSNEPGLDVRVRPVTGLYPGARPGVSVVFHNGQRFDVLLTAATTSTTGVRGCEPSMFALSTYRFHPAVRLRPGGNVIEKLPFGMRTTAASACQKRAVTVRVTGHVVRP